MPIVLILFAFFLGSVPFGLYIAKTFKNIDPRDDGSRNTGATNVARLCGFKYGVVVLALDILKGAVPVWMASIWNDGWILTSLVMLAAVLGHVYSPFLNWKGGKAVATTLGAFMAAAFLPTLFSAVACLAVIFLSGFVSMGSLTFAVCLPVFSLLTGNVHLIPIAVVLMALMFWRHRENIQRLAKGEEKPWRKSKHDAK
ncbi:glycerol-3-phosphate 1-O-acyltransferase PlsY [Salidesulfovibrio onnuriiensis]|uniref:glycerol-3-phosphate 1-O-acyltransferase PlsY n=1 Tax=Salidesulfovibrio onnuriiensis TaxID=2583823 RepID=UPI0011CCA130|nr:glycerol-3-phosphate 1-O-acyltransferase PlsY [Salidesulfovibrio onnuriiensis]